VSAVVHGGHSQGYQQLQGGKSEIGNSVIQLSVWTADALAKSISVTLL
jgi:hypothetical protein